MGNGEELAGLKKQIEELAGLKEQVRELKRESKKGQAGIWLEVAEVQFETGDEPLRVQLKGDRAHPRLVWWTVSKKAVEDGEELRDAYRAILREMDRKRVVLARLTWEPEESNSSKPGASGSGSNPKKRQGPSRLHCDALRFQSAELGSR